MTTSNLDTVAFKRAVSDFRRVPTLIADGPNVELFERAESLARFRMKAEEYGQFMKKTAPLSFAQTAYAHIERLGYNQVVFTEKTLLDERQFRKIKSDTLKKVRFDTAIAICVGLDLGLEYGEPLLAKADIILNSSDMIPYKMLLCFHRGQSIYECNEFLTEIGARLIRERAYREMTGK
jgi:hypothetical protein